MADSTLRLRLSHLAVLLALGVATTVVAGVPDPARTLDALTGGAYAGAPGAGVLALLLWTALAGMAGALLVGVARPGRAASMRPARRRSLAWLVLGVLMLVAGLVRHGTTYSVCCASPSSVEAVEHLVR